MFITLTIDTASKKAIKLNKNKFNAAKGWQRAVHIKRRSLIQKFKDWKKAAKTGQYRLNGQPAMF